LIIREFYSRFGRQKLYGMRVFPYKEEHKISGDLGALQAAVAALQAKMEDRQDE
jgi:hypothetical protein